MGLGHWRNRERGVEIGSGPLHTGRCHAASDMTDPTEAEAGPARLRLLGAVEMLHPRAARWPNERRFRLAAYLALRGDWVNRDQLATLFWPDRPQDVARSNLRKLLQEVRALALPQLESDRNSLRWNVSTDLADYKAAIARGDTDAALALYGGPALRGLDGGDSEAFSAWLASERRQLHAAWRDAVLAAMQKRDPSGVLQFARLLLEDDPCDEDAVVAALEAHHALHDHRGAAQAFRDYAERLIELLGVEPSARVRRAASQASAALPHETQPPGISASNTPVGPRPALNPESFIGRTGELQELSALLANRECRLLTVTGPGGMGKSRLVKEAVRQLASNYADGVIWIALDDLTDVAQVAPRIAAELALVLGPRQDPVERVAAELQTRQVLLVLDNSEHLPALAALVERLLAATARLQVLSTSRARIGIAHEWLLPLAGLALPPPDAASHVMLATDAIQLFVAHAKAAQPRFDVDANARHIARLVRAVGGLPLAILLAASWVRLLPMTELVNEVTQSLDLLERADDGEERPEHRSVRATFEQSWRLLAPTEQRALAALSVMSGTFKRTAASDVAQAPLALLASLADKSLLQVDVSGRFSLHPLVLQFAAEKLAIDPAMPAATRDRHAEAFARFMKEYLNFETIDQPAAVRAIAAELSNVHAAWNWSIARPLIDALRRCATGLSNYYQARGPIAAGAELFARAQQVIDVHAASITGAAGDAVWRIPLEHAALNYWLGDYRAVEAAGRKALDGAKRFDSAFGVRASLNTVALALLKQGRPADAARHLEEALARAIADKAPSDVAAFAGNLVDIKRELGDDEGALRLAFEAMQGHRANGHHIGEISMTNEIGLSHHKLGRPAEAVHWYEQGLQLAAGGGMEIRRCQLLTHMASALLDAGEPERARQVCREALQAVLQGGLLSHEPTCRRTLACTHLALGDLGDAHAQLAAAIVAARRIGTAPVAGPVLRDCAAYFEHEGDVETALRCVACAHAHRSSDATPLARYGEQHKRLRASLDSAVSHRAEVEGAAMSVQGGLDLAARALGAT